MYLEVNEFWFYKSNEIIVLVLDSYRLDKLYFVF